MENTISHSSAKSLIDELSLRPMDESLLDQLTQDFPPDKDVEGCAGILTDIREGRTPSKT